MRKTVKFTLYPRWDGCVEIQWVEEFRGPDLQFFLQAMVRAVEPIVGIEYLTVGRYSLVVHAAHHVLAAGGDDVDDLANEIASVLDEDPDVLHNFRVLVRDQEADMLLEVADD